MNVLYVDIIPFTPNKLWRLNTSDVFMFILTESRLRLAVMLINTIIIRSRELTFLV